LSSSKTAERTGVLATRVLHEGSRSERASVVVVADDGTATPLHVVGENPFSPSSLEPLLGARVRVSGTLRNRTLRVGVDNVAVLEPPAVALPSPQVTSGPQATTEPPGSTAPQAQATAQATNEPDEQEKP
jgi:hypothetical protein